jgi:hypothetical protein
VPSHDSRHLAKSVDTVLTGACDFIAVVRSQCFRRLPADSSGLGEEDRAEILAAALRALDGTGRRQAAGSR